MRGEWALAISSNVLRDVSGLGTSSAVKSRDAMGRLGTKWEDPGISWKKGEVASYHKAKPDLSRVCILIDKISLEGARGESSSRFARWIGEIEVHQDRGTSD